MGKSSLSSDEEPYQEPEQRRKKPFANTLFSALKELEGWYTTIELNNETKIKGLIAIVSSAMDFSVQNAVVTKHVNKGNVQKTEVENLFIRRNKIRFVHFPDSFNIIMSVQQNEHRAKRL